MNSIYAPCVFALAACLSPALHAAPIRFDDGLHYRSDDGRAQWRLGGTLHLDGSWLEPDEAAGFGSAVAGEQNELFVRRAYLTLSAQVDRWLLRLEPDLALADADNAANIGLRDAYLGLRLGRSGELTLGQRRPARGLEDLTDDNDLLLMERPFAGQGGTFAGGHLRDYVAGLFYRGAHDRFTWGIDGYSLRTLSTNRADGFGASARGTWTPIAAPGETLHLGLSATWEDPQGTTDGSARLGTGVRYAGQRGPVAAVGLAADGEAVTTYGLELASAFGPWFTQAEFMAQSLAQAAGEKPQDVFAWYLQAGWLITGESRRYDRQRAVFSSPQPHRPSGAWELAARYDGASNRDVGAIDQGCGGPAAVDECDVQSLTAGLNYYLSPGMRVMLNYTVGEQDRGAFGRDRPRVLAARIQLSL